MSISMPALSLAWAFAWSLIAAPAQTSYPGVQPQLTAIGDRVYLAFGLGDTISLARSDDRGESFGSPTRLPLSGKLALGMHRGPRVAATDSTVLVAAVAGAKGGGADGDVLLFRSQDQGTSWTTPVVINDVAGSAREGLHALAANPSGLVAIAWLDLRAGGTRIFAAVSRDHGATWAPDALVYAAPGGSVCECCHPSVAIDGRGRIAVMFRNNVDGNRDMYVVSSASNGEFGSATKLGVTSWPLNACPMDGGGLAFDKNGVAAAWRRENAVFLSNSLDPERRLGTGRDPAIATMGNRQDIAWTSSAGIMLMRDGGQAVPVAAGRFPTVLALDDRTILAWEDQGSVLVRAIVRQLDPQTAPDRIATMEAITSNSILQPRFYAGMFGLFALMAGTLAVVGIYGGIAFAVSSRTREIGIRMAFGASTYQVFRAIVGDMLLLAMVGIAAGVAGGAMLTRYLQQMLFDVTPLDPAVFIAMPVVLGSAVLGAAFLSARPALTVAPLAALRHE